MAKAIVTNKMEYNSFHWEGNAPFIVGREKEEGREKDTMGRHERERRKQRDGEREIERQIKRKEYMLVYYINICYADVCYEFLCWLRQ